MNEYLELAANVMELEENEQDDPAVVEQALLDRWGLGPEQWEDLMDNLIPWTKPFQHPMSGRTLHAFGDFDPAAPGEWRTFIAQDALPNA